MTSKHQLRVERRARNRVAWSLWRSTPNGRRELTSCLQQSRAQLLQDVVALDFLRFKRDGFFVEVGALDGVQMSNSLLMETRYGWSGILVEPSPQEAAKAKSSRTATVDPRCVWSESGLQLDFLVTKRPELSTLSGFEDGDGHSSNRVDFQTIPVSTVCLNDLLFEHNAPPLIDFLSIDTEGSEYAILSALDFATFRFGFICIETSEDPDREAVAERLMNAAGYRRYRANISAWDSWFIPA